MPTKFILNPKEVATADRIELDLEADGLKVAQEGADFGDAEIVAFMAQQQVGEAMIDYRLPNRTIKIPLIVSAGKVTSFDDVRVKLQAECSRINEEGGWFRHTLASGRYIFADLVNAKLHLSADWLSANRDLDRAAMLEFQALPDFYGDEIEEPAFEGTGDASNTFQVKGNLPARTNLTVTEKSGQDQLGLGWHVRCRNYSADESAAWTYEAEDLTPLDLASITTLSGASPSGSSANNAVLHNNLSTGWTPVLSTNRLPKVRAVAAAKAGTGAITPALPAGVKENDILIMFLETENQAVTVPAGWAHVSGSPVEVASGTTTRLTTLWKRAGASESAPTVEDPGDHVIARIMAVSGCIKTGNPWDVKATGTELVSDTSAAIPGATTTVDGCLVVAAVATGTDVSSSAHASAWTNANLQALTEQMDSWTAEGGGGGFGVATGIKLVAGAYGETTATVGTANFKALMSFALKPETGGNLLTHKGLYDIWARVYSTSEELPWLRLLWDVGDIVAPSENVQVRVPGQSNLYLVNLGQVNIREMPVGTHRWQAVVQARGEDGGENVYVDQLGFFCADEGSGVVTGNPGTAGPASAIYLVRDEFNQSAGNATGKSAAIGGVYAAVTNSDTTDFEIDATTHRLKRTAVSDTGTIGTFPYKGRGLVTPTELADLAFSFDISVDFAPSQNVNFSRFGQIISYVNNENFWLVFLKPVFIEGGPNRWEVLVANPSHSVETGVVLPEYSYGPLSTTLLSIVRGNTVTIYVGGKNRLTTSREGIGAKGKVGIFDERTSASAITREYDTLAIWIPQNDAAVYANRNANLTSQGIYRQSKDGLASGPVAYPGSDLLRIPVSGPEKRPVEIAVKPSRGDFGNVPDSGLDKVATQLSFRPCWSGIPEG